MSLDKTLSNPLKFHHKPASHSEESHGLKLASLDVICY